jgi:hypothetical protein
MMNWPSPALALTRVLALMLVSAIVAAPLSATAQAAAFASSSTRSCGFDKKGIGIEVRASKNVSCALARSMMEKLLLGSEQCYPHGYTAHPKCTLNGFRCSTRKLRSGASEGRCVKGRRLATGTAGP